MTAPAGDTGRPEPAVLTREVPGGLLALAPDRSDVVFLGGTAAELWELLRDPATSGAPAVELGRRYPDADPGQIEADLRRAVGELEALGLVRPEPGDP